MKLLALVLAGLAILGLFLNAGGWYLRDRQAVAIVSAGPTVERLERLSYLVVTHVVVADVLIGEGEGYKGCWLVKGDGLIGTDLGRVKILEKDEKARRATVQLPQPEVLQSRVDHDRTTTWEVKKTSSIPWNSDQDRLRDHVMREAQRLVAHAAGSAENIRQARSVAEAVIAGFYRELAWEVTVIWQPTADNKP